MVQNDIYEILEKGENSYVEFKEEGVKAKDLAEEIIAFANAEGGIILIGVNDGGNITGVTEANIEEKVMNICRNNCIPNIIPCFEFIKIEDKLVAILTIQKGSNKPYYTIDNKYYIRVGSTKRIASREELLRLFEANGALHYEISPVLNTSIEDLNLNIIREYFLKYNAFDLNEESKDSIKRILYNADLLTEEDGKFLCTVGGLLIFGNNPEKRLSQNGISFAHFKGNEITDELIDKKTIEGRIPDIAEHIMVIIKNNIKNPSVVSGLKRLEREEYPMLVLREAIVNTLVHRNYSISGSKIRIFMFDDRLEFHSPGRLPNTVTIEKMRIGVSYARNPLLVKYMENLRYIDQLGRGIPMIIKAMRDIGAKEPLMQESGEEFILTIYN